MARTPGPADVDLVPIRNTREVVPIPESPLVATRTRAADAASQIIERVADSQNEVALARADMDAGRQLEEIRERFLTDEDWETAPDRARVEAETILKTHGESLRGARTQRAWQLRSFDRIGAFDSAMRQQARERGVELARANLVSLQERALELAGDLSMAEEVRQTAVVNYNNALDAMERRGLVGADWAASDRARFSEAVRSRAQDGLRGEFIERLALDPGDLADDLEDDAGAFSIMPADERARMVNQARQSAASRAIDAALEETLRTGRVVGEEEAALSEGWQYLNDGARLQYAERASRALDIHQRATALGSLTGKSLTEIITMADQVDANGDRTGWAARTHLRVLQSDPASYVVANQPNIAALQRAAVEAVRAAQESPDDPDARMSAVRARQAYVIANMNAQAALGLSSGEIRIHALASLREWSARVRRHGPEEQQAILDALPQQMLAMYGDENLAERATLEHLEAFYAAPSGQAAPPPNPTVSAAQGADYDSVRGLILRALRNGADLDDPRVDVLAARLAPADRARLMQDQEIARAGGAQ